MQFLLMLFFIIYSGTQVIGSYGVSPDLHQLGKNRTRLNGVTPDLLQSLLNNGASADLPQPTSRPVLSPSHLHRLQLCFLVGGEGGPGVKGRLLLWSDSNDNPVSTASAISMEPPEDTQALLLTRPHHQ